MQRSFRQLGETQLLDRFAKLVEHDRRATAALIACVAEIDKRKLWAKHACSSMFFFCVERFHMSEAIAAKRIRAGRAASRYPSILEMLERGELHLSGVHQLARYLTKENHRGVLARAKHKTMREIDQLIAEIVPQPDVPSSVRKLPHQRAVVPLSPRRYKIQITIGEDTRDKLRELQELLSHRIPDGDPAVIIDRALDALLCQARKQKASLTIQPRQAAPKATRTSTSTGRTATAADREVAPGAGGEGPRPRAVPAAVQRQVWARDEGRCRFVDDCGNRCTSRHTIEFHHTVPYALGGRHTTKNIELRCRAHNQYEAELAFGRRFIEAKRSA